MEGGWVFLSHSHQDIAKVRKIRNHLESLGFEPLMFYLKCLTDKDEITDLIKREIDERDWFIYADSPNARASEWVRTELEHIHGSPMQKNVFTVDLNEDIAVQLAQIEHVTKQMKVFISYSHRDRELCRRVKEKLLDKDMQVLTDEDLLMPGSSWYTQVHNTISATAREGFVLLLLTSNTINSLAVRREIEATLKCAGKIIPIYVGDVQPSAEWLSPLREIVSVTISEDPSEVELDSIVQRILKSVDFQFRKI